MVERKPNILWFCTDEQRFDTIKALGNQHVHTPTLDKLVERGTAFTRTYCQYPVCTPSRASFMTGRYPSSIHVNYNGNDYFPKEAEATLISRILAESGYDCGLVGKFHLSACAQRREPRVVDGFRYFQWSHSPRNRWKPGEHDYADWLIKQGEDPAKILKFKHNNKYKLMEPTQEDDNVPVNLHHTTWNRIKSIEFLESAKSPWFLCMNTFEPHPPICPPWEYFRRFDVNSVPDPYFRESDLSLQSKLDEAGVKFHTKAMHPEQWGAKGVIAGYYAMIEQIDEQLSIMIQYLEEVKQLDNTIIIFTSDHGAMMGDHGLMGKGCRFYEGLVRVPLIWCWADRIKKGLKSDALVELIDIAPTLLDLAGIPIPEQMQGRSLMPILTGGTDPDKHREFVRSEYYDILGSSKKVHANMLCDGQWKLITYHDTEFGELYDLMKDPWEFNNLWDDPIYYKERCRLIQKSFDASVMIMDPGPPCTMDY